MSNYIFCWNCHTAGIQKPRKWQCGNCGSNITVQIPPPDEYMPMQEQVNTTELRKLKKTKYKPVRPNETINLGVKMLDSYDGHPQYIPTMMQEVANKKTRWFDKLSKRQ